MIISNIFKLIGITVLAFFVSLLSCDKKPGWWDRQGIVVFLIAWFLLGALVFW